MPVHKDAELFRESIDRMSAHSGFQKRLIEKDYYCSLILSFLAEQGFEDLVFKGGTCISKVYTEFYRMSEDLDFVIPIERAAKRSERRRAIKPVRAALARLSEAEPALKCAEPLSGHNESKQYIAQFSYRSAVIEGEERVKVEIGLREPLLMPSTSGEARTLLMDALKNRPVLPPIALPCMAMKEVYAEKIRAALSRRTAAIRDFYDLDYAVRRLSLNLTDKTMVKLVRLKLAVADNEKPDVSEDRLLALGPQLEAELKPVLRDEDYEDFNLGGVVELLRAVYAQI